jgi:hypothetical protein
MGFVANESCKWFIERKKQISVGGLSHIKRNDGDEDNKMIHRYYKINPDKSQVYTNRPVSVLW